MQRIFISYSRADADFADELASSLSKRGLYVWIDDAATRKNKKPGVDFGETLDPYDVMLVIVSPDSMASPLVEAEWRYFRKQRKLVILLLWRPTTMSYRLQRLRYIDFYRQDYDIALKQLQQILSYRLALRRLGLRGVVPQRLILTPVRLILMLLHRLSFFLEDDLPLRPVSTTLRTYLPWLPIVGVMAGMALYLVACLPPGGRFIYPLGRWFGTAVTSNTLIGSPAVWVVFVFTCLLLLLLPRFLQEYIYRPAYVIMSVMFLVGCCYLPYFFYLIVGLDTSRWTEIDIMQTPDHRFYLVERSFDSGSTGTLLMMCDDDGFLCELMVDHFLLDSQGYYISNWRDSLSLEVVGDVINVRDGSAVVFTIPIP